MESGYEAALDLLEKKKDIAVLSCATDTIAAGAIEAILACSREKIPGKSRIPGTRMEYALKGSSIKVTGFGDKQFLKAVPGVSLPCISAIRPADKGGRASFGRDRAGREDPYGDETGISDRE